MSSYIVELRTTTYLCRGKAVTKKRNATVYSSPSAAKGAGDG